MNSATYIFGELSEGYSQYPEDGSSNLFKEIRNQCIAPSQLIIHRDENLMYYIYVRKFEKRKYIGFAIAINGYYFTLIEPLFSLFEKELETMAEKGVIVSFTDDGEFTSKLSSLSNEEEEVISIINRLHEKINKIKGPKKLPAVDFYVSITSRKLFKDTDSVSEIVGASCRFGFTIILKEADYDTVRTTSYKNILKNLNADKSALIRENEDLKENVKKIKRQKKQFKNVVFLLIIVMACSVGLYFLYENLNDTQDQLDMAENTITQKKTIIKGKDVTIAGLRDSVCILENDLESEIAAKERVENSLQKICSYAPFAVTSCDINASQFRFDYFCTEERNVTVTLKAINDRNNEIISNSHTLTFYKGTGSKNLDFYRTLDSSQYYYVVLIYDGHIIAGKRW